MAGGICVTSSHREHKQSDGEGAGNPPLIISSQEPRAEIISDQWDIWDYLNTKDCLSSPVFQPYLVSVCQPLRGCMPDQSA